MALNLRRLTIAASICLALPLAAQASVLTLDFEDLNLSVGTKLNLVTAQPYVDKLVTFSGAVSAEKWDAALAGQAGILAPPNGLNFAGGVNFEVLIDTAKCTAANAGTANFGCFNHLTLNALAVDGSISVYDDKSSTNPALSFTVNAAGGTAAKWLTLANTPLNTVGLINRIVFAGNGAPIFFDGLSMAYGSSTGGSGGTLPEPGGLALAGLALAGLALTRRRSRRTAQA